MTWQHSRFRWILSAALITALGGCAAIPKVDETTPQVPAPPPQQPPLSAVPPAQPWDERPLTKGAWRYDAARRTASYMAAGQATPVISMTCAGGAIQFETQAFATRGQAVAVDFKSSFGNTRLRFEPHGTTGNLLSLSARDHKLDQMAFSRGRFALDASNGHTLTLPAHAEVGRVIEDCRG